MNIRTQTTLTFLMSILIGGAAFSADPPAVAGLPMHLDDNLLVKAEASGGDFQVGKENSLRVYLLNSLSSPLSNVKLKVNDDRFDATITPSPTWKTCPELPAAGASAAKEYFTLTLKPKGGFVDDAGELNLRVYATCQGKNILAADLTLAEALDAHHVPVLPALKVEPEPQAQQWGNSLVLKDFMLFQTQGMYRVGSRFYRVGSTGQTRVQLAADDENLNLLVSMVGYAVGKDTEFKIRLAPEADGTPIELTVNESTCKIASSPAIENVKCVKRPVDFQKAGGSDSIIYQVQIPRKSAGITKDYFYANFVRVAPKWDQIKVKDTSVAQTNAPAFTTVLTKTDICYWRGNELTSEDPVVFGKFILGK